MRRPIRSNVIQRRMFNGGMGMTKPGAPVASGILASSQPLVDVLASQARDNLTNGINVGSQMYGSNVQGTNLMNQGGIANYSPGGISYGVDASGQVSVPVSGSIDEIKEQSTEEKVGLSKIEKIKNWFSNQSEEIANTQDVYSANILAEELSQKANTLMEKTGWDIYKGPLGITGEVIKKIATYPYEVLDSAFSIEAIPTDATKRDAANKDLLESEEIQQNKVPVDEVEEKLTELQSSNMTNIPDKSEAIDMLSITNGMSLVPEDKKSSSDDNKSDAKETTTEETTTEETAPDDPYDFTDKDLYDAFGANIVDDVRANANANDTPKVASTLEEFKEEFKNAMPEYQGMSDEEKGNAWIKMGMAVAAGQSGNAITNIANGVLATIDEFADDPKQKREYEMKVALAGSKYALQRLNEERVKLEGLEKEGRTLLDYVTSTPFTFNGKEYIKGDAFQITRAQFDEGILAQLPAGAVVQPAIFKDMEDTLQSFNDFQATLASSGAKMSNWIEERDKYTNTLGDMKSGINMRLYLGQAADLLNNGDVLGGRGIVLSGFDQALNFLGLDQGQLNTLRSKDKQAYNQKMKEVGTQMLTQILGETNRTISDNDRKLVNELTALIGDYKATGLNLDVINEKILSIDRKIQEDLQLNTIKLQGIESTWSKGTKVKDSPVNPSIELQRARKSLFPTQRGRATTAGNQKIFKYEDIWDTENNVFKRGIEWE